jgi:NTE family protein
MRYRLGLVLSGGGSRGLAHAGVLHALSEHGIEPDCISATSSGALVGALHATGRGPEEILTFFETTSPFRFSRLAPIGKPGWIDTEKIADDFLSYFPGDSFEALDRPLFVTATDLVSGQLEVFSSGPLVRPLIASASIPPVFTPTLVDGRWYADGGILDNFPVEPLSGLCDVVVGVHVSPLTEQPRKELDNSLSVAQRALEIGMYHAASRKYALADLVIAPAELVDFGTFDFKRHREIVEIGHRAASARVDDLLRLIERRSVAPTGGAS